MRVLTHPWAGLLLLIALLLPLKLWRASREGSIWLDERATIALINQPVNEYPVVLVNHRHPPGYLLLLKSWVRAGRELGIPAGIFWARSLNVALWVVLCGATWFLGGRILDAGGAAVLTWAVGAAAQTADMTKELRLYALASVACFTCFLVLLFAWSSPSVSRKKVWIALAALGTIAVYAGYVSLPLLGWILGFALAVASVRRDRWLALAPLAAFAAAGILLLPWLILIRQHLASMPGAGADWRTPATWMNLLRVFTFWYPFGQISLAQPWLTNAAIVPGAVALLLPFTAFLASRRSDNKDIRHDPALLLAIGGLSIALGFVTTIWILDRVGLAKSFHGPRYPAIGAPFWAAGIAGFAILAARRVRRPELAASGLILPWLLCSLSGQAVKAAQEDWHAPELLRKQAAHLLPPRGGTVYAFPTEFMPYQSEMLAGFHARPVEDLRTLDATTTEVVLLALSPWRAYDKPRDRYLRERIDDGTAASRIDVFRFPPTTDEYVVTRLTGIAHGVLGNLP